MPGQRYRYGRSYSPCEVVKWKSVRNGEIEAKYIVLDL